MALTSGTRLGPYEIVAPLGSGGMGEVYRARDTKLNRDVAIKVLRPAVANDPDRLARFSREAQVLASLNHPNIAHIYGIEDADGVKALVLELVEGEDLAQRLTRGAIPIDEALPIAKQIADALEAAHEQGIIHRDLKPANIKVRPDGTVKVLDFGLAKAMDPSGASSANAMNSPTLSMHATQAGIILGTAAYMSPEQARGKDVDKRADIWAFGVVLFEMLTGRRAFAGDDVSDTLVSVFRDDPDWSALPADTPAGVVQALRVCLKKDPKQRVRDITAVRLAMDGAFDTPLLPSAAAPATAAAGRTGRSSIVWKVVAGLLAVTALGGVASVYFVVHATQPVMRFLVAPPEKTTFVTSGVRAASVAISPDGRTLAFTALDAAGKTLLWIRPIDTVTAQPLAGTDDAAFPFWSPDSRFIAYMASGKLLKVAVGGGPSQTIALLNTGTIRGRGGAWGRDGTIVFSAGPGDMRRVSSAGGQSAAFRKPGGVFPSFLPDGRHVLFYDGTDSAAGPGIWAASLDDGASTRLVDAESGGVYVAQADLLLFARQGTLFAQPFDPKAIALKGEPFPIAEDVATGAVPGVASFSVSDTGALAYGSGFANAAALQMVWLDRQGKAVGTVGPPGNYRGLDLSPDGTRVAAHRHDRDGGDIWVTELVRGTTSRFTFDPLQENSAPVWSPDGRQIAFGARRDGTWGLYKKSADGAGTDQKLLESDVQVLPTSWSPDSASIVYVSSGAKTNLDLWMLLPLHSGRSPTPVLQTPFAESHGQISPDGKWIAYQSNEAGQIEVYVRPFPSGPGKWQLSTAGGLWPRWRHDGGELFYMSQRVPRTLMAVDVKKDGPTFVAGASHALFEAGYISLPHSGAYQAYAASPDGQRFLVPRPESSVGAATTSPIVVVLNWATGLKK